MTDHYVTMEANYLHAVWGPFTLEDAIAKADEFAFHPDEDGHHTYYVRTMPLLGTEYHDGGSLHEANNPDARRNHDSKTQDAMRRAKR